MLNTCVRYNTMRYVGMFAFICSAMVITPHRWHFPFFRFQTLTLTHSFCRAALWSSSPSVSYTVPFALFHYHHHSQFCLICVCLFAFLLLTIIIIMGFFFYTITGERFFDDFDAFVSVLVFLVCYTRTSFAGPLIPSVDVCFFETSKLSSAVESVSIGGVLVVAVAGAAITVSLISDTVVSDWISLVSYCCFEILSSLSHPPPNPSPLLPSVLMMTSAECAASIASGKLTQHIFIGGGDWWWCTSEICGTWSFPSSASLLFALESVRMQWPLLLFFERLDDWWRWLTSSGSSSNLLSTISILFVDGDTVGGEHDDGGCGGDGADDGCAGGGNGADGCCGVIGDTFCSLHGSDVLLQFVELLLKFDKTLLKFIVCVAISTYRTQPFPSAPGWIESG